MGARDTVACKEDLRTDVIVHIDACESFLLRNVESQGALRCHDSRCECVVEPSRVAVACAPCGAPTAELGSRSRGYFANKGKL
jgi:hypothetical protein